MRYLKRRPVKLSKLESELLKYLPADGRKVTTAEIVTAYYGGDAPMNARQIITDRLATLTAKLEALGAEQRVAKSARRGPHPIEFWLTAAPQQ